MKYIPSFFQIGLVSVLGVFAFSLDIRAQEVPVIIVEGGEKPFSVSLEKENTVNPDSTALLKKMAGAGVVKNGPLTGFAQYRGMFGQRINTVVDGVIHTSGGPNWMDAPMHYAPASQISNIQIYRGAAPVSSGQETIGGSVIIETQKGQFADSAEASLSGDFVAGVESNNGAKSVGGMIYVANKSHWFVVKGLDESADDTRFHEGDIIPSEYERNRFDVDYGFRYGAHEVEIGVGRNETGDAGTPALPMDILSVDTDLYRAKYVFHGEGASLEAGLYGNDVEHEMTNYHLREAPSNMMLHRLASATGESQGAKLVYRSTGDLNFLVGVDGHRSIHNTDITNPNNTAFLVTSFNDVTRESLGVFAESLFNIGPALSLDAGIRVNQVRADADSVSTKGLMGMMLTNMDILTSNFNTSDLSQQDNLFDWVATLTYEVSDSVSAYLGLSQKNRAPSYQERYLWAPLESTGGLADGNTYIGNIDLDPEESHELNLGVDISVGKLEMSPRLFYRYVDDYIQGVAVTSGTALMVNNMMNPDKELLQFANVDAKFHGFDMNWSLDLVTGWSVRGVVSYVRGERRDINDDLYRISPPNALYAVDYDAEDWGVSVENHLFAKQHDVSETNNEQKTSGYGVVNISAYTLLTDQLTLTAGVENAFDRKYRDHLVGYNRAANNDIEVGERLPGKGRNLYIQLRWGF